MKGMHCLVTAFQQIVVSEILFLALICLRLASMRVLGSLILFINLLLHHEVSSISPKLLKASRTAKETRMLYRHKRTWIIDTFELQEELPGPYPLLIGTVNIERGDQVSYKLTGKGVDEDPKGLFHINEDNGAIYVHQKIDYEKTPAFQWIFKAINRTSFEIDTKLGVQLKILDINDNAPQFTSKRYEVPVNESTVQGATVFSVTAHDIDDPASRNSEVHYYILSQTPSDPTVEFTIDQEKGFLSFKGCLNYEATKSYKLIIQAKDNGIGIQQSSTCEVSVSVIDGNNHLPEWTETTYTGNVYENEVNLTVLRVGVVDRDTLHTAAWRAVYTITDGNEKRHYKIETDPKTNEGILTVIKAIDFESSPQNKLSIMVVNEEPFFSCNVKKTPLGLWSVEMSKTQGRNVPKGLKPALAIINIKDVNDPPEFHPSYTTITVEEETMEPGTKLAALSANDSETVFPNTIHYILGNDPAGWISLDENTGVITTKTKLDRESKHVINSSYLVTVFAVDDGIPPLTATGTLAINLKDINDNTPRLGTSYTTICEGQEEVLITIPIMDEDLEPYSGPFHFESFDKEDLKKQLKLKGTHGDALQLIKHQQAARGNHTLHFQIADRQGAASLQNLSVYVCECLDKANCAGKGTSSALGGAAIALLVITPLILLVASLLFCKIETGKAIIPIDQEPLNSIVIYNEEGGVRDCETLAEKTDFGAATRSSNMQTLADKTDVGMANRSSNKKIQPVEEQYFDAVIQTSSTQGMNRNNRQESRKNFDRTDFRRHSSHHMRERSRGAAAFDRADTRRHSSYHIKERHKTGNDFHRASTRRYSSFRATGTTGRQNSFQYKSRESERLTGSLPHRTSRASNMSTQYNTLRTMEHFLNQNLGASSLWEEEPDKCKPRVFAEEGTLSRAVSLEAISMPGSSFNLNCLQNLGSKFNILESICAGQAELHLRIEEGHSA